MHVGAINRIDQRGARVHLIGAAHQFDQQVHFARGQGNCRAVHAGQMARRINLDYPAPQGLIGGRGAATTQDCLDAGDQLARGKRLGQIIIRAHFKADNAVNLVALRGQKQDRHIGCHAHGATHLKAVHFRQADVQHHQIGLEARNRRQPVAPVACLLGLKARLAQRDAHHIADVGVIIDDQNCAHAVPSAGFGAPRLGVGRVSWSSHHPSSCNVGGTVSGNLRMV